MNAFDELQRRMSDRSCNLGKFSKDVCAAWCGLYLALGGRISGDYSHSHVLPNATRCVNLIVAARTMEEKLLPFPHGKVYRNGKDGQESDEYKAWQAQPNGALSELWEAAADACEESVSS